MSGLGPCGKRLRAEAALLEHRSDGADALRPDSCATGGAAPQCERVARSRLSFGDELDDEQDGPGIAASTAKRRALDPSCSAMPLALAVSSLSPELAAARMRRFLVERKLAASAVHGQPRASPFAEPSWGVAPAAPQASLGRLCYGVAQARGALQPPHAPSAAARRLPLALRTQCLPPKTLLSQSVDNIVSELSQEQSVSQWLSVWRPGVWCVVGV